MNPQETDLVTLYADPRYKILITRDHYKGAVYQILRLTPIDYSITEESAHPTQRRWQVIWTQVVATHKDNDPTCPKNPVDFKRQCQQAEAHARYTLGDIQSRETMIDGVLADSLANPEIRTLNPTPPPAREET